MTAIANGHSDYRGSDSPAFGMGRSTARPAPAAAAEAPDETLIARIAAGDHGAVSELYRRHSVRIYRYALRFVGDRMQADDITSETFTQAWRHASAFAGRSAVLTWLFGIARHKALTARNVRTYAPIEEATEVPDTQDDPETLMLKMDRSAVIRDCLARLSPLHREIIDLVYYHEKSVGEIAHILAISPSTVRTRMFYARKRLAALMREVGWKAEVAGGDGDESDAR
jgi:RNA polymerase sigma-70 factor (ECF subfamily)